MARTIVCLLVGWDDKSGLSSNSDNNNGNKTADVEATNKEVEPTKDTEQNSTVDPDTSKPSGDTSSS